jgi:hypothetical protein
MLWSLSEVFAMTGRCLEYQCPRLLQLGRIECRTQDGTPGTVREVASSIRTNNTDTCDEPWSDAETANDTIDEA